MSKQKAVIFDAMGVVFVEGNDTVNLTYPYMVDRNPDLELQVLIDAYIEAAEGRMTAEELWKTCGFTDNIAQMEADYLDTMLELDPDIIDVLESLSRHYRLAMLSNDIGSWSKHLRQHHGLDEYFEEAIISGDVLVRKPDPRIYEIAAERLGLKPQECVFVDDRPGNLEPAAQLGMRTILYNRDGHDYDGEQILSLAELPELL
ncbi:MAG: HAD family phosphatase [Oscillospiraceae bacterium]|nr:HAD family phosphatase [Oscillospiraceae bacterium]